MPDLVTALRGARPARRFVTLSVTLALVAGCKAKDTSGPVNPPMRWPGPRTNWPQSRTSRRPKSRHWSRRSWTALDCRKSTTTSGERLSPTYV